MKKIFVILPVLSIMAIAHPVHAQEAIQDGNQSSPSYQGTVEDGNKEEADHISSIKNAWAQLTGNIGAMKQIVIKNYKDYERKNGIIPKDQTSQDHSQTDNGPKPQK